MSTHGSEPEASDAHGTPPPACFTCASSCLSRDFSPPPRFFTLPACHLVKKFWTALVYADPAAVMGDVLDFGFAKIFRKVAKWASGLISFDVRDAFVVGTFRRPLLSTASAWLFVVRYLTRSHACDLCFTPRGIPMIVPLMYPEPYSSGWAPSTGIGAVP